MPRKTPTRPAKPGIRARAAEAPPPAAPSLARTGAAAAVEADLRRKMVATEAYYLAERRGFAPGHELADWVAAEAAVAAALAEGGQRGVAKRRPAAKKRASRSPP
ncbi:MAG TPA: DUF2934 domain-containing protein [Steroidobacteraceae bacterium]|nr:DUF2934 domain-containing protein [Steroidobacteraceae bacterium]